VPSAEWRPRQAFLRMRPPPVRGHRRRRSRASVLDCGSPLPLSARQPSDARGTKESSTSVGSAPLAPLCGKTVLSEKAAEDCRTPRPRGPRTARGTRQCLGLRRRSAAEPPLSGAPVRTKHAHGPDVPPADEKRWQATRTPRPRGLRTARGTRQRLGLRQSSAAFGPAAK